MADLSAVVVLGSGRIGLMVGVPTLATNRSEFLTLVETLLVSRGLGVGLTEAISLVANTITQTWNNTGDVAFVASPDHNTGATVTSYDARVRASGNSTVVATQALGKPTPDGNGVIVVSLTATYAGLPAGAYTVSIATIGPGGTVDSVESNAFTLPIA